MKCFGRAFQFKISTIFINELLFVNFAYIINRYHKIIIEMHFLYIISLSKYINILSYNLKLFKMTKVMSESDPLVI